jgi:hypothetical protein
MSRAAYLFDFCFWLCEYMSGGWWVRVHNKYSCTHGTHSTLACSSALVLCTVNILNISFFTIWLVRGLSGFILAFWISSANVNMFFYYYYLKINKYQCHYSRHFLQILKNQALKSPFIHFFFRSLFIFLQLHKKLFLLSPLILSLLT